MRWLSLRTVYFFTFLLLIVFEMICLLELCLFHAAQNLYFGETLNPLVGLFYSSSVRDIVQYNHHCARYDSNLSYTLKPGVCTFRSWEFETTLKINSAGFRDDENSLNKPDIIVLGDSFAMGWGVESEQTFAELLEKRSGLRVLNSGCSSYGTAREIASLSRIDTSAVKYLIVQYSGNDFEENQKSLQNAGILPIMSEQEYDALTRENTRRSTYRPFMFITELLPLFWDKKLKNLVITEAEAQDLAEVKTFLDVLLSSAFVHSGVKIIVFAVPPGNFYADLNNLLSDPKYRVLKDQLKPIDIVFDRADYFKIDEHLQAIGHEKIANEILRILP